MSQVTIYLPREVEQGVRRAAKAARKSLSAYLRDLARGSIGAGDWPPGFDRLYGSWKGEFPTIADAAPEPVELPE